MKVKTSVRRICRNCDVRVRRGVVFVFCKSNPRHKQRQKGKKKK
ncbi:MAG: 50S ribosomal protein L36 [Patescibacteria group bacterium]